jgi:hypothetical protein
MFTSNKILIGFILIKIFDGICPTWQEECAFIGPLSGFAS